LAIKNAAGSLITDAVEEYQTLEIDRSLERLQNAVRTCANSGCHDGTFEPDFRTLEGSYNTLLFIRQSRTIRQEPLPHAWFRAIRTSVCCGTALPRTLEEIQASCHWWWIRAAIGFPKKRIT
jgi:hypothetical protein